MMIFSWLQNAEEWVLLFIQQYLRIEPLNILWKGITFLGDKGWFWIVLAVLLLFFQKTRKAGTAALLAMGLGALITNLGLKPLVARPRPYDEIVALFPLVERLQDYSFPSGHTCASFACAAVYGVLLPKKWGRGILLLAIFIGLSRLYVGVHYPSDVLFGGLVGWISGKLILKMRIWKTYH